MIAPLRNSGANRSPRALLRARMAIASALLTNQRDSAAKPALSAWRAWIWAAWMALVAICFAIAAGRAIFPG